MLMKDGTVVPKPLVEALENDIYALKIFLNMSQTYQKLCVMQVIRSDGDSMRKRVADAMEGIYKYGKANEE